MEISRGEISLLLRLVNFLPPDASCLCIASVAAAAEQGLDRRAAAPGDSGTGEAPGRMDLFIFAQCSTTVIYINVAVGFGVCLCSSDSRILRSHGVSI